MPKDSVHIVVTTTDGRRLEKHVDHAVGSLERPMTDAQLDGKFEDLCTPILGADATATLNRTCRNVAALSDAAEIARAAAPG